MNKSTLFALMAAIVLTITLVGCQPKDTEAVLETSTDSVSEFVSLEEISDPEESSEVLSDISEIESSPEIIEDTPSKPAASKSSQTAKSAASTTSKTQTSAKSMAEIERDIRDIALEQVGKPYVYGGATPSQGFDCSGLIYYVLKTAASVTLPRTHEEQTGGNYGTVLKHRDEVKIGDVIECEMGLALYIGNGEAVYSWGTVQKFKVMLVSKAVRYISGQGSSSDQNPCVYDLNYKITDPSQIESVRLTYQAFTDCTNKEINIMRGYQYNFSAAIEPYTETFNKFTFTFSDGYENCFDLLQVTDGGFKIGTTNTGRFTFTATSLNGKTATCTVVIE